MDSNGPFSLCHVIYHDLIASDYLFGGLRSSLYVGKSQFSTTQDVIFLWQI